MNAPRSASEATTAYMPQLDGIRAFAISGVLFSHFFGETFFINRIAHWGRLGVILFFVLSGFLITGILLKCRDSSPTNDSRWRGVRVFYARRALRIFPIYYLTIFICVILQYRPVQENLIWHVTYLSNISGALFGTSFGHASHLWSLCVEEQFYLTWPCVVIFAPRRLLPKIAVGVIASAICYKLIGSLCGLNWTQLSWNLFGCLDSLGLGALLAIEFHEGKRPLQSVVPFSKKALLIGLPALLGLQCWRMISPGDFRQATIYVAFVDFAASLCFVVLIRHAAMGSKGIIGAILDWSPIRGIGKISYGIYLYHLFLLTFIPQYLLLLKLDAPPPGVFRFLIYTSVSIILAAMSWYIIEKPINKMKKHFPYAESAI